MKWMFVFDLTFYVVLGFVSFCPIVVFVSAATSTSFSEARKRVTKLLNDVASLDSENFLAGVYKFTGLTTVIFLLGLSAYAANRAGDAAMPAISRLFGHSGDEKVRWSIEESDAYGRIKFDLRELTEIRGDRVQWEETKQALGAADVRLFRTLVVLSAFVVLGGIIGVFRRPRFSARNGTIVLSGVAALFVCYLLWVDRESKYIENMVSRYRSEHLSAHQKEPVMPTWYKMYR